MVTVLEWNTRIVLKVTWGKIMRDSYLRRNLMKAIGIGAISSSYVSKVSADAETRSESNQNDVIFVNNLNEEVTLDIDIKSSSGRETNAIDKISLPVKGATKSKVIEIKEGEYSINCSPQQQNIEGASTEFKVPSGGIPEYWMLHIDVRDNGVKIYTLEI